MKLSLTLPDELYETYAKQSGSDAQGEVAEFMVARLDHFQSVDPKAGWLHVDSKMRGELEKSLGSFRDVADMVRKVSQLGFIELGGVRLDFTPGQLAEIKRKAERNGETAEAYTRRIVKMYEGNFFAG